MTGFLGTQASVYSDIGLILEVLATLLFTVGYFIDRRKGRHCIIMGAAVITNIIFVISYMVSRLLREQVPTPPEQLASVYRSVVIIHGVLSVLVLVVAASQVFFAYRWRKKKNDAIVLEGKRQAHKKLGIATLAVWYMSLFSGVIVYVILYIL